MPIVLFSPEDVTGSFKTLLLIWKVTWHHVPKGHNFNTIIASADQMCSVTHGSGA